MGGVLTLLIGGCVGQNPWWDPPADGDGGGDGESAGEESESSVGDRGGESSGRTTGLADTTSADSSDSGTTIFESGDGPGSASVDDGSADATGGNGSTTTASGDTTAAGSSGNEGSSDEGGPSCDPPFAICDGECRDVTSDHHHCGVECIDCMDVYGPGTHCVDSVCDVRDDD